MYLIGSNYHCLQYWLDIVSVVVPRPGVRPRRGGENLISPEELVGKETIGPAYQQQSQAAGPVFLYPLLPASTVVVTGLVNRLPYRPSLGCHICLQEFCAVNWTNTMYKGHIMNCCEMPWPASSSDVIETCLFVLWRHLEYYLLHCTPTDPKDSLLPGASLYRSRLTDGEKRCHG